MIEPTPSPGAGSRTGALYRWDCRSYYILLWCEITIKSHTIIRAVVLLFVSLHAVGASQNVRSMFPVPERPLRPFGCNVYSSRSQVSSCTPYASVFDLTFMFECSFNEDPNCLPSRDQRHAGSQMPPSAQIVFQDILTAPTACAVSFKPCLSSSKSENMVWCGEQAG